ncbi:MAG TPA: hydroxymyristoyl-ACP dehydratase [Burkholderiaceae bacterium]|nr:hydroxymyristoyl-ACP dehydratase [Burkholderiaceae bacterium]
MLSDRIEHLLPHVGAMRMIAAVVRWSDEDIECTVLSHRDAANPMRIDGRLPAVCGLEYGAQAMALHGALVAGRDAKPRVGLLVAAHELAWQVARLDTIAGALTVCARCLLGSAYQVAYEFDLRDGVRSLVHGRASVMLAVA